MYFRLCFSFSCPGCELTFIKKESCIKFLFVFTKVLFLKKKLTNLLLVTVVAQFTAKTTNSEKTIYFLSLRSCSINKVSHVIHTSKFYDNFMFCDLRWKRNVCSWMWGRGWRPLPSLPLFLNGPGKAWRLDITETRFKTHALRTGNINLQIHSIENTPTESTCGGSLLYISYDINYICRNDHQLYKEKSLESTFRDHKP